MHSLSKLGFGALLAAATVLPSQAAFAAPMSVPAPAVEIQSEIQDVRYVRRCNYNRCRTVWVGPRNVRPRVVIRPRVVVRPRVVGRPRTVVRPVGNRHVNWCLNRYRSYDPSSNTFVTYGGEVRRCISPFR